MVVHSKFLSVHHSIRKRALCGSAAVVQRRATDFSRGSAVKLISSMGSATPEHAPPMKGADLKSQPRPEDHGKVLLQIGKNGYTLLGRLVLAELW